MSQPPEHPGDPASAHPGAQSPGYPPPPPPPGYGAPPPGYPPQPGFGSPYGAPPSPQFDIGEAVKWSWGKFTQNAAALIVPVLAYAAAITAAILVAALLPMAFGESTSTTYTDSFGETTSGVEIAYGPASIAVMIVGYVLLFLVVVYMHAALLTGGLDLADGRPVSIGSLFRPRNLGTVLITSLLIAIGIAIGSILCFVPGLIFALATLFALTFVIDRSLSPVESIKASIATVRANIGPSLLSWLVQYAVVLVGELLCGVGIIVALPIAALIQVYTYRKLSGGQVVPLDQPGYPPGPPPGPPPGQQFA
ncbi:hypothetical protein VT930_02305 [Mycobacterium sherrisii]|uniref:hypothetical protein n=1 Tax=Mycobacterium sherrisii TaxID=243061 RepID=UPI002DDD0D6C|nr:hypothetical protein [Mycobacterium sherrisii]MEC4761947.1 hypothetical protein [Mycobacterium sherrisii]